MHFAGFKLSLDNVGSGNAGIEITRQMPLDFIKIDRTTITKAATDPAATALFTALITYATQVGAHVIVEGIEDVKMLDFVLRPPGPGASAACAYTAPRATSGASPPMCWSRTWCLMRSQPSRPRSPATTPGTPWWLHPTRPVVRGRSP